MKCRNKLALLALSCLIILGFFIFIRKKESNVSNDSIVRKFLALDDTFRIKIQGSSVLTSTVIDDAKNCSTKIDGIIEKIKTTPQDTSLAFLLLFGKKNITKVVAYELRNSLLIKTVKENLNTPVMGFFEVCNNRYLNLRSSNKQETQYYSYMFVTSEDVFFFNIKQDSIGIDQDRKKERGKCQDNLITKNLEYIDALILECK